MRGIMALRTQCVNLIVGLLCIGAAHAQSVQQSGTVTNGHAACWVVSGVVQDCGTPSNPFGATFPLTLGSSDLNLTGNAPTVTSGTGDCGTSPVIVGNDTVGRVTVGSSTNGGKCTVTFNKGFANKPICMVANETSGARGVFPVPTTTTLAITAASTLTAADSLAYQCIGYQ